MILNIITVNNVYASAVNNVYASVAVPIGSYKLLKFLIACATVGIGFNALEEAEKLMNEFNRKYYDGGEPPNSKEIIMNLLGMQVVDSFFDIIDNIIDMFKDEQKKEGKNYYNYLDVGKIDLEFETQSFKVTPFKRKVIHFRGYNVYFEVVNGRLDVYTSVDREVGISGWGINLERDPNVVVESMYIEKGKIYIYGRMYTAVGGNYYARLRVTLDLPEQYEEVPDGSVEYYLGRNSKILTGEEVTRDDVKYINLMYIPVHKLEREITETGVKTYYKGTMEELLDDVINNTPWTQIVTDTPSKVYENEEGKVVIDYEPGTEPEPAPEPEPEPENPFDIPKNDINLDFSPLYDINITEKFPFSLPWDVKRMVEMFKAEREAPVWELPIKEEKIIIDFNNFNDIARIARIMNLLIYVIGLVIITRRFISGP